MATRFDGTDVMMTVLVFIGGTAFVSLRVLGEVLDPFQIMWYRFVPFVAIFGVWVLVWRRDALRRVTRRDWLLFAACGFLGVVGYHIPVNVALRPETGVTAATGAILVATTPLWTFLIAVISGQEAFGPRRLLGSLIAFAGVAVVLGGDIQVAGHAVFILVAALLWSMYSVVAKPLIARHGGMMTTAIAFSLGTLYLLPYGLWIGIEPLAAMETRHALWMVYLGLLATVVGYAIWNQALVRRSASEVTAYIYLIPVVATLAGAIILDERITAWFLVGAAMVLYGVATINRARLANA